MAERMGKLSSVCVYCGSSNWYEHASALSVVHGRIPSSGDFAISRNEQAGEALIGLMLRA